MAFPVLFTFSLTVTPWQSLMAGFAPAHLVTIVSTVVAMVMGGFFSARLANLYPVEAGIIASTHSGMGGAGDIAILSTSKRLSLMPFAQIATRTGGGLNVAFALIILKITQGQFSASFLLASLPAVGEVSVVVSAKNSPVLAKTAFESRVFLRCQMCGADHIQGK